MNTERQQMLSFRWMDLHSQPRRWPTRSNICGPCQKELFRPQITDLVVGQRARSGISSLHMDVIFPRQPMAITVGPTPTQQDSHKIRRARNNTTSPQIPTVIWSNTSAAFTVPEISGTRNTGYTIKQCTLTCTLAIIYIRRARTVTIQNTHVSASSQ